MEALPVDNRGLSPDDESIPKGNVVFIQNARGSTSNKLAIKAMSDALDVLGIPSYVILLDEMVDESLPPAPASSLAKKKSARPRYPVLEPVFVPRPRGHGSESGRRVLRRKPSNRTRVQKNLELEAQLLILQTTVHEIWSGNPDGWVLIVETQMKGILDVLKLEELGKRYSFRVHWLTSGSKRRCEAKFNDIVVHILKDKNERRRRKGQRSRTPRLSKIAEKSKAADDRSEVEVLHSGARESASTASSFGSDTESVGGSFLAPPFFPIKRSQQDEKAEDDKGGSRESVTTLATTDSAGSLSSVFEVKSEENLLALERIPAPNLSRLFEIASLNDGNNIRAERRGFVVTVRDLFPGARSQLATTLKTMLRRDGIRAYTMTVSHIFTQSRAVKLMKQYAKEAGHDPKDVNKGCKILVLNGIHFKLAEQKQRVIIVDLEDESVVRMFPVYDFCVKTGVKTLALEKRADGSFEHNLNKVYQGIKKGFAGEFKPRKYRLPQLNQTLMEQLKPCFSPRTLSSPRLNKLDSQLDMGSPPASEDDDIENGNEPKEMSLEDEKCEDDELNRNPLTRTDSEDWEAVSSEEEDPVSASTAATQVSVIPITLSKPSVSCPTVLIEDRRNENRSPSPSRVIASLDFIPKERPVLETQSETDDLSDMIKILPPPKPKLIQIHRWQDRKPVGRKRDLRYFNDVPQRSVLASEDESLFKGWVGYVNHRRANAIRKSNFVQRLVRRIRGGLNKYFVHPISRIVCPGRLQARVGLGPVYSFVDNRKAVLEVNANK